MNMKWQQIKYDKNGFETPIHEKTFVFSNIISKVVKMIIMKK
jgi:hypothetical protein